MSRPFETKQPTRDEIDVLPGIAVLEFGTNWCGVCAAAAPTIAKAFADYPNVRSIKAEDGPGRPLGRSFKVKLWPTLIFLSDGKEMARLVRPTDVESISRALGELAATNQSDG